MAVTSTPNIGLLKPDEAEFAKNWAINTFIAETNNDIVVAKTNVVTTQYTPAVIGASVNPSLGAGNTQGEWQERGGFIFGKFIVLFSDPGVASGTGEYGVSLPAVADNSFHNVGTALNAATGTFSCIGEGYMRDASTSTNCETVALDVVTIGGVSYARLVTENHAGKTSRVASPANPFTLANADNWAGTFFYKKL